MIQHESHLDVSGWIFFVKAKLAHSIQPPYAVFSECKPLSKNTNQLHGYIVI